MKKMILNLLCKFACLQNIFERKYILLIDNTFNNNAELVDNYALFKYLQCNEEYRDISFYIINKNNIQYEEIKNTYKNIIPINNTEMNFKLAFMLIRTKYWLDSFQVINRFKTKLIKYFANGKIIPVYMQHGINFLKCDLYYAPHARQIGDSTFKKIVFSNEKERNLFKEFYGYDDRNTILAGLSRWDSMYRNIDNNERTIFVYFTFRVYLRNKNLDFEMTNYYKNIINFLNSEKLQTILEKYNVKLQLGLHHETLSKCNIDIKNIQIVKDKDIGAVKQNASMLITDYSSMCFDFMFSDRPVAFYRIDANDPLYAIDSLGKINNFNAESKNDELYNICYNPEDIIDIVERYCKNNFQLEEEYKKINEGFFTYRKDIRKHIIEGILSSPENIPNGCVQVPNGFIEYNKEYDCRKIIPFAFNGAFLSQKEGRKINSPETKIWFKTNVKKKSTLQVELNTEFNKKFKWQIIEIFLNNNFVMNYTVPNGNSVISVPIEFSENEIQELHFVYKKKKRIAMSIKSLKLEK